MLKKILIVSCNVTEDRSKPNNRIKVWLPSQNLNFWKFRSFVFKKEILSSLYSSHFPKDLSTNFSLFLFFELLNNNFIDIYCMNLSSLKQTGTKRPPRPLSFFIKSFALNALEMNSILVLIPDPSLMSPNSLIAYFIPDTTSFSL